MNTMNFEPAHKQLAVHANGHKRHSRQTPAEPVHRPSIALILLATTVQIIAMAALLGTVANAVQ